MPDVYSIITEVDAAVVQQVATAMEVSAADPQHQDMVEAYLADLDLPADAGARVVEIGCGTGAIARMLGRWPGVAEVVGTDPSPILLDRARMLGAGTGGAALSFEEADGRDLPFTDDSFDVAVVHRVLSHVPEPEAVLAEAFRVLRPGGRIVVFDGDYATITLATGEHDPLEVCVAAMTSAFVNDPWVVRRLPGLVERAGFVGARLRSYGFVQVREADYMVSIADRGADTLAADGRIGAELAGALKAEARRRAAEGSFFGHVAYASLTAHQPG
jgi:ubiquinone/menaquinone biosynthesis C-methylase UbiE